MKNVTFTNLCELSEDGKSMIAPFSPMEAAKTTAKHLEVKLNGICRVGLPCGYLQQREEGAFTGFDHLIMFSDYKQGSVLTFFIDMGGKIQPVAIYEANKNEIIMSEAYEQEKFAYKLSKKELCLLFEKALENKIENFIPKSKNYY